MTTTESNKITAAGSFSYAVSRLEHGTPKDQVAADLATAGIPADEAALVVAGAALWSRRNHQRNTGKQLLIAADMTLLGCLGATGSKMLNAPLGYYAIPASLIAAGLFAALWYSFQFIRFPTTRPAFIRNASRLWTHPHHSGR